MKDLSKDYQLDYLKNLSHKNKVRFALFCANRIRHTMTDARSLKALDVAQAWLDSKDIAGLENITNFAYIAARDTYAHSSAYAAAFLISSVSYPSDAALYANNVSASVVDFFERSNFGSLEKSIQLKYLKTL